MTNTSKEEDVQRARMYGNHFVGVWRCLECKYERFPRQLMLAGEEPPFICPICGDELLYDEEE